MIGDAEVKSPRFEAWGLLKEVAERYHREGEVAREEGRKVAWCTALSPHEFLSAMDFHLVFPEHESAVMGATKVSVDLCEVAEERGYPPDLCSYARTSIGRVVRCGGLDEVGELPNLPRPDLLMACNNGCMTFNKWFESLSRELGVPLVFIDTPFLHDGADAEDIQRVQGYVGQQLGGLPAFLEEFTGRRFDYERLTEAVAKTGSSMRAWIAGQRMGRNRPSPLSSFDTYNLLLPLVCLRSRPEALEFAEALAEELAQRVEKGIGAVPGERYRLYLDGPPPWFRTKELSKKFLEHQACVVTGIYPVVFECFEGLDSAHPIETMAESLTIQYSNRAVGHRTGVLMRYVEEYQLDGMIMQWPQTCKPVFLGQYDQIESLRSAGVPCLIIEGDMCDSRLYNEAETDARIDAFLESLERWN
jgi:benzoyl-CoA reductase/2-hydroxyglutaryl-CoA dehydratase subunit BcrC/BadD/HgdB